MAINKIIGTAPIIQMSKTLNNQSVTTADPATLAYQEKMAIKVQESLTLQEETVNILRIFVAVFASLGGSYLYHLFNKK